MPTTRRRRTRNLRADVPSGERHFLRSGEYGDVEAADRLAAFRIAGDAKRQRSVWAEIRDDELAAWIDEHPGRRPWGWWRFDAPREPLALAVDRIWRDDERTIAHRRRIGGSGTPEPSALIFSFGIPECWIEIDLSDPPRFESEATYLQRHRLLTPGERRRLTAEDFKPTKIEALPDDDEDGDTAETTGLRA